MIMMMIDDNDKVIKCEISFFHRFSFSNDTIACMQSLLGLCLMKHTVWKIRKYNILSCNSSSARLIRTIEIYLEISQQTGVW